jgi:drug/metabolite transporter (DMT)-like permease
MPTFCHWIPPHTEGADAPAFGATDLWLFSAILAWGGSNVACKIALQVVPPEDIYALRMIGVAVLLAPALLLIPRPAGARRIPPALLILAGLLLAGENAFFFWGLRLTTANIGSLMSNTSPLWAALVLAVCGFQLFRWHNWAGFGLGLVGAALMTVTAYRVAVSYAPAPTLGALGCLASAICFGGYIVLTKGMMEEQGALRILTLTYLIGAAFALPSAAVSLLHAPWAKLDTLHWSMLGYSTAISGAYAFAVWSLGMRRANTSRAVLYLYLVPVFSAVAAWIFLRELLSPGQMVGIVVTLVGVYLARPADPAGVARRKPEGESPRDQQEA